MPILIAPTPSLPPSASLRPTLYLTEAGATCSAHWRSERGAQPLKRVVLTDDTMSADSAYRLACEGTGLLWCGDFHNARQLLKALARRIEKPPKASKQAKMERKKASVIVCNPPWRPAARVGSTCRTLRSTWGCALALSCWQPSLWAG